MQFYTDKQREHEPNALPDAEVFHVSQIEANYNLQNLDHADEYTITEPGWYWWHCYPGCLPDSEPFGPFKSKRAAIKDARDYKAWMLRRSFSFNSK